MSGSWGALGVGHEGRGGGPAAAREHDGIRQQQYRGNGKEEQLDQHDPALVAERALDDREAPWNSEEQEENGEAPQSHEPRGAFAPGGPAGGFSDRVGRLAPLGRNRDESDVEAET